VNLKSPYRGLAAFEDSELDALYFFGRERDSGIVVANLIASRLTVLYGPSGVGKSSLLLASVARALRALPEQPLVVVFSSWSESPEEALALAVADAAGVETGSLMDVVTRAQSERDVYLVLDQAEEYFTYHGEGDAFDSALAGLVDTPLRVNVLLSLREDTLASLDRLKGAIPNLFGNVLRLDRLDRAAGRAAIVKPLRRWAELEGDEVTIEDELVADVLDGVGTGRIELGPGGQGATGDNGRAPGIEAPYLQLVMQRLWDVERSNGSATLHAATLAGLGGAGQVVADHLERAIEALTSEQRDVAALLFDHLVTPSGTKIAHDVSDLAQFANASEEEVVGVLGVLADHRILRTDEHGRWEIFHDVLAGAILGWTHRFAADRAVEDERRRRRRATRIAIGVVAAALVLGAVAVFALAQRERARDEAREAQARRLDASSAAVTAADPELGLLLAAESARLSPGPTTEDALRNALLASHLRLVLPLGEPVREVSVDPSGATIAAVGIRGRARAWDVSTQRVLVERHVGIDGGVSITPRRTIVLHGSAGPPVEVTTSGRVLCTFGTSRVSDVAVASDLVVLSSGGVFRGGTACRRVASVRGVPRNISAVVAGPNGMRVAFISGRRAAIVAVPSGQMVSRIDHPTGITSLHFDGAARRAVTAASDSPVVRVWSVADGRLERELTGHFGDVVDVAIDPRGTVIVTGSNDGQGRVWDARTGGVTSVLPGHLNFVETVDITRDAAFVVTGGPDRTARTWTTTARLVAVLAGHTAAVTKALFTQDGKTVVTAGDDGTVRLWDAGTAPDLIASNARPPRPPTLDAENDASNARARAEGSVVRLTREGRTATLSGHADAVTSVAFSPDGGRLVTASRDNDGILWDVRTGKALRVLRAHFGPVFDARFSPDGRWIVTAGPISVGLWNASNGTFVKYLRGARKPRVVAFEDDSRTVVAESEDGTVTRYRCIVCGTTPELLDLARSRLQATGRELTPEERELYLG
jgi:WD40 repeat protein